MRDERSLVGWTIIVVEDEPLIGIDVQIALQDEGVTVLGPYKNAPDALAAVETNVEELDGAVLDVQLGDHTCESAALHLQTLGVPMVLHTGNPDAESEMGEMLGVPVVRKPAQNKTLIAAIHRSAAQTLGAEPSV